LVVCPVHSNIGDGPLVKLQANSYIWKLDLLNLKIKPMGSAFNYMEIQLVFSLKQGSETHRKNVSVIYNDNELFEVLIVKKLFTLVEKANKLHRIFQPSSR